LEILLQVESALCAVAAFGKHKCHRYFFSNHVFDPTGKARLEFSMKFAM
jgi:hypothetical protein